MKIFISWSGERSKQVGLLLRSWLKCVLQASTPWMSDVDIDRGAAWFSEINKALEDCINGVVCITKGNLNKPWLLFEAGALAKGLTSSRVYTFLVDLSPTDISDPLSQFNHTLPTEDSMFKFVKTLNSRMDGYALPPEIIDKVFKTYWPQFDNDFKEVIAKTTEETLPIRKDQDIMSDILSTLRRLDKRMTSNEASRDSYDGRLSKVKNDFTYDLTAEKIVEDIMRLNLTPDGAITQIGKTLCVSRAHAAELYSKYLLNYFDKKESIGE